MADEEEVLSDVEQYTEKLKARAKTLAPELRGVVEDYLLPLFEGQREEYVGGFEAVEAASNFDQKFLGRVMQALITLGALSDQALKRAGWADAEGTPTAECPDDLKMAFGGAQTLASALAAEIKEMQTDDNDNDSDGSPAELS